MFLIICVSNFHFIDPSCLIPDVEQSDDNDDNVNSTSGTACEDRREDIRRIKSVATKYVFSGQTMILPRILIAQFHPANEQSFRVLAEYLLLLLDNNFITLVTLNEHFMELMRFDDWSADTYKQLSRLMRWVSEGRNRRGAVAGGGCKEDLLLSVLSELTANIDDFTCE